MSKLIEIADKPVFIYKLASADMRYIEIWEREIYLHYDPQNGHIFKGEVSSCGPECQIDLSEILLEYAMSCEGCQTQITATEEVVRFGRYLGEILGEQIIVIVDDLTSEQKLIYGIQCILNSGKGNYAENHLPGQIEFSLDCCPLSECASKTGFNRSVENAHLSFSSLCKGLIDTLDQSWELIQPSANVTNQPIHKIVITN
jgi:hypothetical protein